MVRTSADAPASRAEHLPIRTARHFATRIVSGISGAEMHSASSIAHVAKRREVAKILNSWKEIATYLQRGVRTVQRWERDLGLPVHRIGKGRRSPVYATVTDLNFWISTTEAVRAPKPQPHLVQRTQGNNTKPIDDSRRFL